MRKIVAIILFFATPSFAGGLDDAFNQSAAGMKAQSERMKVISQNIANSSSTGSTPGAEPYRRKLITFTNKKNKATGGESVQVDKIRKDYKTSLQAKFDPAHPAANSEGYVLMPNVNTSIENADMKEAQRSYEANLGAIDTTRYMIDVTVDMLK